MLDRTGIADMPIDGDVVGRIRKDHTSLTAFHQIEEVGRNPTRLAAEITRQLGITKRSTLAPVPLDEVVAALDIREVCYEPLENTEGALLIAGNRDIGSILINSEASPERRRFALAHELGHWLNLGHEPSEGEANLGVGFGCRSADMRGTQLRPNHTRHERQEREPNQFAIDLLASPVLVRPVADGLWDLSTLIDTAEQLQVSKQAMAGQLIALTDEQVAIVFSKDGRVDYYFRSKTCSSLPIGKGQLLADLPATRLRNPSAIEPAEWPEWIEGSQAGELTCQTLEQSNGWATTMLRIRDISEDDKFEEGLIEDAYERYDRFSG